MRVYEKGKQLGDTSSPWVRWELELHNRDRIIPWDVLLEPGKYLAAAYPCMDWVSAGMMKITYYLLIYHQRSGMVSVPFRDK